MRIALTGEKNNAGASVATESTTSDSPRVLTPQSSMNFSPEGANGHLPSPSPDQPGRDTSTVPPQDQPIPTIERDSDDSSTHITSSLRTAKGKNREVSQDSYGTDGIAAGVEGMRISSPGLGLDMADMAAAIEGAAVPSNLRSLEPERNAHDRRRRSSSRINTVIHHVQDEEPPQDRFHEPAFQLAFRDARSSMSELADVLGNNSFQIDPDSTIQRLHKEAKDLASFQSPSSRTVGFVGDSGVGTSNNREGL